MSIAIENGWSEEMCESQALKRLQIQAKKTDEEKWAWMRKNSCRGFVVMLDNDLTYVADHHPNSDNDWDVSFDKSIGNAPGIVDFLRQLGITAEHV